MDPSSRSKSWGFGDRCFKHSDGRCGWGHRGPTARQLGDRVDAATDHDSAQAQKPTSARGEKNATKDPKRWI